VTARGGKRNLCGSDWGSGGQKLFACAGLSAAGNNVFAWNELARREQPNSAVHNFDVF
jgi:hypothetical protein